MAKGPEAALHLVATPIGAARDITLRALDILREADVLAAEDTRTLRHLMEIHGVPLAGRTVLPYHDHNGPSMRPRLMAALADGKSVAYASDAGTPLVADPGFQLARTAIEEGHVVRAAPGASAVLAALTVAGLPTDRFLFAGFAPQKQAARRTFLSTFGQVPATLVFYESPKRLASMLADMAKTLGETRHLAVCRELTKRFEEIRRGTICELAEAYANEPSPKGEVVIVVGPPDGERHNPDDIDDMLRKALETLRIRDAADAVAQATGLPRRDVYRRALELKDD
ncbi:16S rRNA (cytidine1402-2'-O)-methyltransferase [Monaibacterium marinum]|uniref:Ribosomal RNA small subunit methyltransferase I n=1 Tax=Pontivivens marinum TaxID=1690039 RepID=A0A2C9CN16_9RHOB|nr:16S rRNA (cytidine(1402)-2'-O)-methyltransferase [Monaibacterium marinum]SOH92921.1 16S rRNA (cytidine1402-2'-O)-methyltransferase [Monaibacterium marinum]